MTYLTLQSSVPVLHNDPSVFRDLCSLVLSDQLILFSTFHLAAFCNYKDCECKRLRDEPSVVSWARGALLSSRRGGRTIASAPLSTLIYSSGQQTPVKMKLWKRDPVISLGRQGLGDSGLLRPGFLGAHAPQNTHGDSTDRVQCVNGVCLENSLIKQMIQNAVLIFSRKQCHDRGEVPRQVHKSCFYQEI